MHLKISICSSSKTVADCMVDGRLAHVVTLVSWTVPRATHKLLCSICLLSCALSGALCHCLLVFCVASCTNCLAPLACCHMTLATFLFGLSNDIPLQLSHGLSCATGLLSASASYLFGISQLFQPLSYCSLTMSWPFDKVPCFKDEVPS